MQEQKRGHDYYLFDLDHFILLREQLALDATLGCGSPGSPDDDDDGGGGGAVDASQMPLLPADCDNHLVVDALLVAGVARFFNHSCEGNMVRAPSAPSGTLPAGRVLDP